MIRKAGLYAFMFNIFLILLTVNRGFAAPGDIHTIAGGINGDGGSAVAAPIANPSDVAVDALGNTYIAVNNRIRRIDAATGVITTVAGNGITGYAGDDGPAILASMSSPLGLAVNAVGNIYIADWGNNRIRKVDVATGVITSVAGNGTMVYSGDNGPATSAGIPMPHGVAVDASGNIYIADWSHRIRRVDVITGIITTVAGNGTAGYSGDNGLASSATLNYPYDIAVDNSGNIYIADTNNLRVRKVDAVTGIISTVAGNGTISFFQDNIPATSATLRPYAITVDNSGNIYISTDMHSVRKVDATTGLITVAAGNGVYGYSGDYVLATATSLNRPLGITVDQAGNLYIADSNNYRIRRVDGGTHIITTIAGNGTYGYSGDNGPAILASLGGPSGVAIDEANNVYIADINNDRIRKIAAVSGVITTVAGNGTRGYSGDNGPATSASLQAPSGVAVDTSGNIYIADTYNYRIRKVDASTGSITTVAGGGGGDCYSGDNGPAIAANLCRPYGVTVDVSGNLYIADTWNHRIRKVDAVTGIITTIAGNGSGGYSGDNGAATSASLYNPSAVAVDKSGNIYIADTDNFGVRKVDATTGIITTVLGPHAIQVVSVALDKSDNLYIADTTYNQIRKINKLTGLMTVLAGTGTPGYSGDEGPALSAALNYPSGVATDSAGNIYIADRYNNRIRKVTSSIVPSCTGQPDGTACTDNDACTSNDICTNGICSGTTISCNDGNVCTDDSCNPGTGCVHTNNVASCDDNNACTANDTCANGSCKGTHVVCNDNNLCTTDSCNPATGCVYTSINCDDNNPCTSDSCDPITGCVHKALDRSKLITTVAGNGTLGYSGDNGPATSEKLYFPFGVALDQLGNIFIADTYNQRIRKVDTSGTIITVAGNGMGGGYAGDNGPATLARLSYPMGIAVDLSGNIFIADQDNRRIRKVDTSGTITTVAGNGYVGYSGDNGPATSAKLNYPYAVTVDSIGNLFIADTYNHRIRKVDTSGNITTVAGNGTSGYSGDNGPATAAGLNNPTGVAVDSSENIYIADIRNNRIRKVDTSGIITTVAGNGTSGYSGDNGRATLAELNNPFAITVDSTGNIYIADRDNARIRMVDTSGTITTVAGDGIVGYSGDSGPALSAGLNNPTGVAVDSSGIIFIADEYNNRIRNVTWFTCSCTGQPNGSPCFDNNACTSNDICSNGICRATTIGCDDGNICTDDSCISPSIGCVHTNNSAPCNDNNACTLNDTCSNGSCKGTPVVCDDNNPCTSDSCDPATGCVHTILEHIEPITTVAGNGIYGYSGDNGLATSARLYFPYGMAVDSSGNIYIADSENHRIRKVDTSGIITTVVGNGTQGYSGDNGLAISAMLNWPTGVSMDSSGNIYIVDHSNNRIRKIDTSGTITTVAGSGTAEDSGDNSPAISARLDFPYGMTVDSSGNLYIADSHNYRIRKVDTSGIITTVAGNGTGGYSGDNGPAAAASLSNISGVAVDLLGNIYISDTSNNRIRKVDTSGTITTVAGNGTNGYSGDNGPATSASLLYPSGVAVDSLGNIYIADTYNNRIRKVDTSGIITTVTGTGVGWYSGDNGPAAFAQLNTPEGVAVDSSGNIFIADSSNQRIRKITSFICSCTGQPDGTLCNDHNACTLNDICSNGSCKGTPVVCNDNNLCTTDSCNPASGCVYTPISCDDNNPCTTDTCNPATGGCVYTSIPIDDGNPCTIDACDPATGNITHTAIACNDNNACTIDSCDTMTGNCVNTPIVCNDNNACTADTCDTKTGCIFTPIAIDDNDACTIDACDPATGVITHTARDCNDNNPCTDDSCNTATGACVNTPKDCNDGNACTADSCDPARGCIHTPIVCNDNNACTTDTCDPAIGCIYTTIVCNDNNACTADSCDPVNGCIYTPISCDDGNVCTSDTCNPAIGCLHTQIPGCCTTPADCGEPICTKYACINNHCVGTPATCNDNNPCTIDSCNTVTGACVYTPVLIDDGNPCTVDACNPATGVITHTQKVCNDNNVCTADTCNTTTGTCTFTNVPNGTSCAGGACQSGVCTPVTTTCPKGSYKKVLLAGTGSNYWWVENQIMTAFEVSGRGCILRYTAGTITATPGTVLKVNWKVGIGPNPTSVTWRGVKASASTVPYTITCPASTGTVGSLVLNNNGARGGKDSDTLVISVATN